MVILITVDEILMSGQESWRIRINRWLRGSYTDSGSNSYTKKMFKIKKTILHDLKTRMENVGIKLLGRPRL